MLDLDKDLIATARAVLEGKMAKKDYDGDGKIESSTDEYKGSRDKAIKKAMAKEDVAVEEKKPETAPSEKNGGIAHDCASHVKHATYGEGRCVPGMHTIEENEDGTGYVTHYDVMFTIEGELKIVEGVAVEDLEILVSESHMHSKKKK